MTENVDSDNVLNMITRRSLSAEERERAEMEKRLEEVKKDASDENVRMMLQLLTSVKELVENQSVDSMCVIARNPQNGIFLAELLIPEGSGVDVYNGFAGKIEAMKMEAVDMAAAGPHMMPDGTYFAIAGDLEFADDPGDDE